MFSFNNVFVFIVVIMWTPVEGERRVVEKVCSELSYYGLIDKCITRVDCETYIISRAHLGLGDLKLCRKKKIEDEMVFSDDIVQLKNEW